MPPEMIPNFFITYTEVMNRIADIDPVKYAQSRNYLDGNISYLSPFITHGIISTKTVYDLVLKKSSIEESEKLIAELGWREFFHRVWQEKGSDIFDDLRYPQHRYVSKDMPRAIYEKNTSITVIDDTIELLESTGYMHNHARMWVASIACNVGQTHWYQPSRWLYYHLLDGDLASNTLSWQWIVGSFSQKKYYANQTNLNKFSHTTQSASFLDIPYEDFDQMPLPSLLEARTALEFINDFPASDAAPIRQSSEPIVLHSIWTLDPFWRQSETGMHVLWIDPQMHKEYALSPLRWRFISHWAAQIPGLKIFVGSQDELFPQGTDDLHIFTKEYPATAHWPGHKDEREWCFTPKGYFQSFFSYWKQVQKQLPALKKRRRLHQP